MLKWKIAKLTVYVLCFLSAITFVCGIAYRFPIINAVGFKLTEYWALSVFGLIFAVAAGIYAAVKAIITATFIYRAVKNKNTKNPVNLTKTTENLSSAAEEDADIQLVSSEECNAGESEKIKKTQRRKNRAERRRERLLNEKRSGKKFAGVFGIASVLVCIVFSIYFACWAFFPNKLCFHNFAYNLAENECEPETGEIRNYRFYQSYTGRPYVLYSFGTGETFRVYLESTESGHDENGLFTVYKFSGSHVYGKILDKLRDKNTVVNTQISVKYYVHDAHIVVDHTAKKERAGVVENYGYSGKIYSYKNLSS